ncbi:MAG: 3-phosphoshikimate 1-carboxyvinyltransferase [Chloroflexota bacterium]
MNWRIHPSVVSGSVEVPGDKSIAHRALMLASLACGTSTVHNLPAGEDVRATIRCLRDLGTRIEIDNNAASVSGDADLKQPDAPLDAGNSGTTTRMLSGIVAGMPFDSTITGDASLRRRPMQRIIDPLRLMGAELKGEDSRVPLNIHGRPLEGIRYDVPIASAQVKSCLLFAGLHARGTTIVVEPEKTRDHTERLFDACGIAINRDDGAISVMGGQSPQPFEVHLPGDVSTAAFFFAAAALSGEPITVRACGANPTRVGFLRVLQEMGVDVQMMSGREILGEPIADIRISGRAVHPCSLQSSDIPGLVDEIPLLALVATQTEGVSVIRGARELRYKECDRIHAIVEALGAMGADIDELDDGLIVRGPTPLSGSTLQSYGDHRIAMMLAVAGTVAREETLICDAGVAAVSFPQFDHFFRLTGADIDVV